MKIGREEYLKFMEVFRTKAKEAGVVDEVIDIIDGAIPEADEYVVDELYAKLMQEATQLGVDPDQVTTIIAEAQNERENALSDVKYSESRAAQIVYAPPPIPDKGQQIYAAPPIPDKGQQIYAAPPVQDVGGRTMGR